MSCKVIPQSEFLCRGWGCCQENCRTYNSDARETCKHCNHKRCGAEPQIKVIPYRTEQGTIVLQPIKVPDPNKPSN